MRNKLYVSCAVVYVIGAVSCGNTWINDEYDRVAGAGDPFMYTIAGQADVSKIQAHPNGSFLITSNDNITIDTIIDEFGGKIQGQGKGEIRVSGMFAKKAKNALFKDIVFNATLNPPVGTAILGIVAAEAENTQFINVQIKGDLKAQRVEGKKVVIGGIVGIMDAKSKIERCGTFATPPSIEVSGSGDAIAGGLVGQNNGGTIFYSFSHSSFSITATNTATVGGIAGILEAGSKLSNSYYANDGYGPNSGLANVTAGGTSYIGGLVGNNTGGSSTLEVSYTTYNTTVGTGDSGPGNVFANVISAGGQISIGSNGYETTIWYRNQSPPPPTYPRLFNNPD
ncbi:MAG: hypothetical protein LBG74_03665, partial [Spirochaetaceae bacterium]|nr:hypothetical protein [Spirochaetaceae bacterium]